MENRSAYRHHSTADQNFFNYKEFHSMNLMAVCDAGLKFTFVDVGLAGHWNDSWVLE